MPTNLDAQKLYIERARQEPGDQIVFLGSTIIRFGDVSRKEWEEYNIPGVITSLLKRAGVNGEQITELEEHGGLPSITTGPLNADHLLKFAKLVAIENNEYEKDPYERGSQNWVKYKEYVVNREIKYVLDKVTEQTIFNFLPRCLDALLGAE